MKLQDYKKYKKKRPEVFDWPWETKQNKKQNKNPNENTTENKMYV